MTYINKMILEQLTGKYSKAVMNKIEVAYELDISVHTLNNWIVDGHGIPEYKKLGTAKNSRVVFPIICVAEFLSQTIKVAC